MRDNKLLAKHVLNILKKICNHLRCCKLFKGCHETGIHHEDFKNKNLDIFSICTTISVLFNLVPKL